MWSGTPCVPGRSSGPRSGDGRASGVDASPEVSDQVPPLAEWHVERPRNWKRRGRRSAQCQQLPGRVLQHPVLQILRREQWGAETDGWLPGEIDRAAHMVMYPKERDALLMQQLREFRLSLDPLPSTNGWDFGPPNHGSCATVPRGCASAPRELTTCRGKLRRYTTGQPAIRQQRPSSAAHIRSMHSAPRRLLRLGPLARNGHGELAVFVGLHRRRAIEAQAVQVVAELEVGLHHLVPGDSLAGVARGAAHQGGEV